MHWQGEKNNLNSHSYFNELLNILGLAGAEYLLFDWKSTYEPKELGVSNHTHLGFERSLWIERISDAEMERRIGLIRVLFYFALRMSQPRGSEFYSNIVSGFIISNEQGQDDLIQGARDLGINIKNFFRTVKQDVWHTETRWHFSDPLSESELIFELISMSAADFDRAIADLITHLIKSEVKKTPGLTIEAVLRWFGLS